MDWFELFVAVSLVILAALLVILGVEAIHVILFGTPLVGEWIVWECVT